MSTAAWTPVSLAVVSAGVGCPRPARRLADRITEAVCRSLAAGGARAEAEVLELHWLAADLAQHSIQGRVSLDLREAIAAVVAADGLVVATPVRAASPSKVFDSFLAILGDKVLSGMPVPLALNSGSDRQPPDITQVMRRRLTAVHAEPVPTVVVAGPVEWQATALSGAAARLHRPSRRRTRRGDALAPAVTQHLLRIRSRCTVVNSCFEFEATSIAVKVRTGMKAVRFHEYGDPSVLRHEDVEQPVPGAGEVRVRVAATSFNPVDGNIRGGFMQGPIPVTLPHTPGIDVAGTVDALGEGVDGIAVGEDVVGFLPMDGNGAAAQYVLAPADVLIPAPKSVPLADAAALPLVGLTAYQALFDHGKLTAGQRVLINGAGGAVGGYAVQLAKNAGAHVIATAGPRSSEAVTSAGADEVIDHTATDVTAVMTEPVDLALNLAPVAPDELASLVTLVRPGGVVVNTTVWMPAPSDEERDVRGIDLFVRSDTDQLAQLVALIDRGELRVDVAERVPLAELPALHARASEGAVHGKVIVVPSAD